MQAFEGGTAPADFSPCGVCLERNSPQLFKYPEGFYSYLRPISPIAELLLIPVYGKNAWVGTIWVICHEKRRHFDREDARLMIDLGRMASAAILANRIEAGKRSVPAKEEIESVGGTRAAPPFDRLPSART